MRQALEARRIDQQVEREKSEKWKAEKAAEIWHKAGPFPGTLAQDYLAGRDISGSGSTFLRFDPSRYHSKGNPKFPAMIGGVTIWPGDDVCGIHQTYLNADGGKLTADGLRSKSMLGRIAGGAVRLSVGSEDGAGALVLCEGIETGLSVAAACPWPVWAALSTSGLKNVVVPPVDQVGKIIIAADHDRGDNPGLKAAEDRAAMLHREGYEVCIAMPPKAGQDFNDLHREAGLEAVRRVLDNVRPFGPEPFPRLLNGENWPFVVNEKGVFHIAETTTKDGEERQDYRFLSTPLHVEALTQSGDGSGWGRMVCVIDTLGQKRRVVLSAADLADPARGGVFRILAAHGATIKTNKGLRDKLLDYLLEAHPDRHLICAGRIGWDDETGAFVLPDKTYGGDLSAPVIYAPQGGGTDKHPYRVKGSLDDWKREIAEPCRGNSRLVFSLCVACTGPLLRLVDGEGGVFHFSGGSSIGKSTTLAVAGSFWGGGGLHGFRDTWRATDNALESKAMTHSDTLICLDELGQADAQAAQKATYMLAQGSGKARMTKAGDAQAVSEWRINGLSSGEIGMSEKLAEGRSRFTLKDGQEARFVEIPADADKGMGLFEALGSFTTAAELADHLREAATNYYGVAGRSLLEAITLDRVKIAGQSRDSVKMFKKKLTQSGAAASVDRVATRFALVATSGVLAAKRGILPFTKEEIQSAVIACFQGWLWLRGGAGSREVYEGTMRLAAFISKYGQSRFQDWEYNPNQNIQTRAGFRRPIKNGTTDSLTEFDYFMITHVLKGEVLGGLNVKECIAGMVTSGVIEPDKSGVASISIRVPSVGKPVRLYQISGGIFALE